MKKIFSTLFILVTLNVCFGQQAWTKEKGKFFAQIGTSALTYNAYIDSDTKENLPLERTFLDATVSLYGEYGITDYLTVTGQLPFKYTQSSKGKNANVQDGSISGLSNINLGLTARLYQHAGTVLSAKVKTLLPTGKYDDETGLRTGFDATTVAPSLMWGYGASKYFTSAEAGFELRSNGYTNRAMLSWQIGKFFANKKLLGIVGFEYLQSLGSSTYDDQKSKYTGLYLSTQTYLSPQVKIGYYVTPKSTLWFSIGAGLPPTDDIPASPGFSLSYSYSN